MDRLTILMTCILLLCAGTLKVRAQNDPVLAGMILLYTDKAQKELKSQEKVMLLQTTGHIWTKEEIEGTTDLQREFNDYLDSFRSIVCYAAQTYGFYHEISRLTDNLGDFSQQLARHPSNALAVALSSRRNKIYRELILGSVEIVNDIRTACLSDNKMTEKERMEVVSETQIDEQETATPDHSGEIHHDGRHLDRDRRRLGPHGGQARHRGSRPTQMEAERKESKTLNI